MTQSPQPDELRLLSLCGFLGYGFPTESLAAGITRQPHMIGVDSGSSDPGPYYLGNGAQVVTREQLQRDLGQSLRVAREANIPYVVGSTGTAGGDPHLESVLQIVKEVAQRDRLQCRVALIRAEIPKLEVKRALREGRIRSMGMPTPLTEDRIEACVRIVAQMGVAPIARALEGGADIVLAGRACDTAIFATLPIMKGYDPGLAFHMAKIMECGAQCAIPTGTSDCLLATLRKDHFDLEPLNESRKLTPLSVAAHTMYEQPDPYGFFEPEGKVDLSNVRIESLDERRVRVYGARLIPEKTPTIKLEGAHLCGYRAIAIAGITDPALLANLDETETRVRAQVKQLTSLEPDSYQLRFIYYGRDGVLGPRSVTAPCAPPPEVGVVMEAIAKNQEAAGALLALTRSTFLHQWFPGRKATGGNLAFPFSPSDFRGGPVYEFSVYHLMEVADAGEMFPVEFIEIGR